MKFVKRTQISLKRVGRSLCWMFCFASIAISTGCAAFSNPVQNGIPVNRLPTEMFGESREELQTIPLNYLRGPKQDPYLLAANDVLGVWIRNVTGEASAVPPVFTSDPKLPPAIGFPFPIREDGTVSLPLLNVPVKVVGLSVTQAEKKIKDEYIKEGVLLPDKANSIVTLHRVHTNNVTVIRQDSGGVTFGSGLANTKRGTGIPLDLPANESDVANALSKSGALPGLDAKNEVLIFRGGGKEGRGTDLSMPNINQFKIGRNFIPGGTDGVGTEVVRIPLRLKPGTKVPFLAEDVALNDGDIVFIETRETELYYTGGLLPTQEVPLPRDYDLDVLEAVAQVRGPLFNGGQGSNGLNGQFVTSGLGSPHPTNLTIIRKLPNGKLVHIHVDLAKAARDPRERINVKPNDFLVLQETYGEALTRYITQSWTFNFGSRVLATPSTAISASGRAP